MRSTSSLAILLLASAAFAQQTAWGQCGGNGWTGATTCVSGYTCTYSNPWYSQCLPGNATTSATPTTPTSTSKPASSTTKPNTTLTTTTTKPTSTTTTSTPTTSKPASTTVSAGYPGTTLQTGYYWIRAVEDPNFHKYLQTSTTTLGLAILDSYTTAGQFQIVSGQLVQLTASGLLYANVETQANSTVTKLGMTFKTTQNTYGTFQWSGDALQWSVPTITRPNLSAWLVCANQQLFINLGAYLYMTPAGCADETIHFYNGATAVS